jgi:hypothetical protein
MMQETARMEVESHPGLINDKYDVYRRPTGKELDICLTS